MSLVKPANEFPNPSGQIVRYALTRPFPPVAATVAVAEAFRGAVLSALHSKAEMRASFLLSGHHPDGKPDADHRHAYYLPKPDSTGKIRELLVVSPRDRFSEAELVALRPVKVLRWNGPSTKTSLELVDPDDHSERTLASHWISLTPYVPIRRFWGTSGKHHLTPDRQLCSEIVAAGCNSGTEGIKLYRWGAVRVRLAPASKSKLPVDAHRRIAYRVEFIVRQPLCGPIVLGHSCHFGLGHFVPVSSA